MSGKQNTLFELEENKNLFDEICEKLKFHPFDSPWEFLFPSENCQENYSAACEVEEFDLPDKVKFRLQKSCASSQFLEISKFEEINVELNNSLLPSEPQQNLEKLHMLKDSLIKMKELCSIDDIRGIEILPMLSLSEIPELCSILQNANLSETSVTFFIGALLNLNQPLSITLANSLVSSIVHPKVLEMKHNSSRNFLASILNLSEIYPKAVIDELIIPCLKDELLDSVQLDMLFKMAKSNIPNGYISYCFRSIVENSHPNDNTFSLLLCLVERKFSCNESLYQIMASTVENWSTTHSKNLKFTKLLVSILNTFSSELLDTISSYQLAVERNKTIMKKAAENALRKAEN